MGVRLNKLKNWTEESFIRHCESLMKEEEMLQQENSKSETKPTLLEFLLSLIQKEEE